MVKEIKQVIVIRKDIDMSIGKIISQACHASLEAYKLSSPYFKQHWKKFGYKKVILKVFNLNELLKIYQEAKRIGLPCAIIKDAGKTQVEKGTITCVAIGPHYSEKIDKVTGNLKLL